MTLDRRSMKYPVYSLLFHNCVCFNFWLHTEAWEILVSQPKIELAHSALEGRVLTLGPQGEVPMIVIFNMSVQRYLAAICIIKRDWFAVKLVISLIHAGVAEGFSTL